MVIRMLECFKLAADLNKMWMQQIFDHILSRSDIIIEMTI